ncbi:MAG: hypothetical protein E6G09_06960 [Actinobacteria bacterium]|nr:MAG: hypothetical protein E6G09_06960 [Actinomycetota bacterium]
MVSMVGASSPAAGASSSERISSRIMRGYDLDFRGPDKYRGWDPLRTWAARTIFCPATAHLLDSIGSSSKNGFRVSRRLLAALFALVAFAAPAATTAGPTQDSQLQRRLARALHVPHVAPARSGAVALDLASGTVLFEQNPGRPLAPASNEKLPLTYAALVRLGPAFRIETDVLGEGQLDGTQWTGTLVLKGNGDPTLSSADLRALAAQVKSSGIRSVTGGVSGDESAYDARRIVAGWKPSFFIDESPPLSALVVDRARVGRIVSRSPALAAATAFRDALLKAGIAVAGPVRAAVATEWSEQLASVSSPPLGAMLRFMDRESDNFTAEMLLKQLGLSELGRGTSAAGAAVVTQALSEARVPMTGVRISSGSGRHSGSRRTCSARGSWMELSGPALSSSRGTVIPRSPAPTCARSPRR